MNKITQVLLLSSAIATGGTFVANTFTENDTVDKAKTYIEDSYDLLERYRLKKNELEGEIKTLDAMLETRDEQKDNLQKEIDELKEEMNRLRAQNTQLENLNSNLQATVDDLRNQTNNNEELRKANSQISIANEKVSELDDALLNKILGPYESDVERDIER